MADYQFDMTRLTMADFMALQSTAALDSIDVPLFTIPVLYNIAAKCAGLDLPLEDMGVIDGMALIGAFTEAFVREIEAPDGVLHQLKGRGPNG